MQSTLTSESLAALDDQRFVRPQKMVGSADVDISALLANSLNEPLDYPPIKDSVFAGDTVAIVLQRDLPKPTVVLNALLDYLLTLNVEPTDITVVLPGSLAELFGIKAEEFQTQAAEGEEPSLPPPVFPLQREFHLINCQVHDPENAAGLSYLCANEAGEPVHVNRVLVDADVVIPVGGPVFDRHSSFQDCIYPAFGSSAAIARFLESGSIPDRHAETELANDSLGAFFIVQTVAGPGEYLTNIISGDRKSAMSSAAKQMVELWSVDVTEAFDAAIVTIEARAYDQSWQNFAAALEVGSKLVDDGAPLVVWSDLSYSPDRDTRRAFGAKFEETIPDSLPMPMQRLAATLKDHPVYLRSKVTRATIEELGLTVIETVDELKRLTSSADRCVILRDAHGCQLSTNEKA